MQRLKIDALYKLDDFKQLKTVGTGTFGRVILCQHKETDEFYAIKVGRCYQERGVAN